MVTANYANTRTLLAYGPLVLESGDPFFLVNSEGPGEPNWELLTGEYNWEIQANASTPPPPPMTFSVTQVNSSDWRT